MTWSAGVHDAPPSWLVRTVPFGIGPAKSSSRIAHTPLNSGWMPSTGASIMPRHGLSLRGRHRRAAGHRARHGVAADRGIVMRTGEAFQTSWLVRRIVLDKAGTLTEGKPTVRAVCPVAGHEDEVLALAAAAKSHPASARPRDRGRCATPRPHCRRAGGVRVGHWLWSACHRVGATQPADRRQGRPVGSGVGTDIAVEPADIVLLRDQVGAVLDARDISDRAYRHTRGNIALAFLFNGIGVPLATTGLVYPVWAMVAMAASVTTIFVNSVGTRPSLLIQAIFGVGRQRIEDPKIAVRQ